MDELSRNRAIQNEQLFRRRNQRIKQAIKRYFKNDKDIRKVPMDFSCECSQADCKQRITLSIRQYEKIHRRKDHFVILADHLTPQIEKVVDGEPGYIVVEKFELPA